VEWDPALGFVEHILIGAIMLDKFLLFLHIY